MTIYKMPIDNLPTLPYDFYQMFIYQMTIFPNDKLPNDHSPIRLCNVKHQAHTFKVTFIS